MLDELLTDDEVRSSEPEEDDFPFVELVDSTPPGIDLGTFRGLLYLLPLALLFWAAVIYWLVW